eukprot:7614746-Ditylum_brightwellii.AAC.2
MYNEVLESQQYESSWKEIDEEEKVISGLLLCIKLYLHQAWNTLFSNGPLKDNLGTDRLGKGAQDIPLGCYLPAIHASLTTEEIKEAMC